MVKNIREIIILFLIFTTQVIISLKNLDLNYLWFINIDEWAFHGSILRIFQGLYTFDLKIFYGTGFFNYGHLYFLINSFFSYPFYLLDNTEGMILVPRIISSLSSITTLIYLYKIFKYNGENYFLPLVLIISFPSFWINSTIFHPDYPYTCFVIISMYYLLKDNWKFGSNFMISCFMFAVSFSLKIQAITVTPLFIFYILYNKKSWTEVLKYSLIFITVLFGFRIISNPYLLHPEGLNAFIEGFLSDMNSNKTNHGNGNIVSFYDKIQMINNNYLSYFSIVIISLIIVFSFQIRKLEKFTNLILFTFVINISYLFIFVNKAWQHYYIIPFILLIILLNTIIKESKYKSIIYVTLLIFQTSVIVDFLNYDSNQQRLLIIKDNVQKVSLWLKNEIDENDSILVDGSISVDMDLLNLNYQNIHRVYGELNRDHFFKYNNHYPGKSVKKKFVIISNKDQESNRIKNIIPNEYILFKEDTTVSVYVLDEL